MPGWLAGGVTHGMWEEYAAGTGVGERARSQ